MAQVRDFPVGIERMHGAISSHRIEESPAMPLLSLQTLAVIGLVIDAARAEDSLTRPRPTGAPLHATFRGPGPSSAIGEPPISPFPSQDVAVSNLASWECSALRPHDTSLAACPCLNA